MQWTPLPAAYRDSVEQAVRGFEGTVVDPRAIVGGGMVLAIGLFVVAAVYLRDVPCAVWLLYQELRARRKRSGEVERARGGGM